MTMALASTETEQTPRNGPHFVVGRDGDGHWVARDIQGLCGGVFRSRKDAVQFALKETLRRPDAITLSEEPIGFGF